MAATALLSKNARPSRDEIVSGMNRNICRCGVYQRIIEAIQIASAPTGNREGCPKLVL